MWPKCLAIWTCADIVGTTLRTLVSKFLTAEAKLSLAHTEWQARRGVVPSLDGLRAISICVVLLGHFMLPASMIGVSALGVKIFFFISGFLITRLLLAENKMYGGVNLPDFFARRFLRLYPVLIAYMSLVVGIVFLTSQSFNPLEVVSVFLYFVNYLLSHHEIAGQGLTLPIGVLWSLSVEEHFYLFAPLVFVLMRGDARKMLAVAVAICAFSLGLRLLYAYLHPWIVDTLVIYKHSETRFDSIAFGVILACLTEFKIGRAFIVRLTSPLAVIFGVAVLLGVYCLRDNYFESTWRFTMQGLALCPIVAGVVFGTPFRPINWLLNRPLFTWVGKLSYSLYVWHGGVVFLFAGLLAILPRLLVPSAEVMLTFALATLSFFLVERPTLSFRDRFRRMRPLASPTSQPAKA